MLNQHLEILTTAIVGINRRRLHTIFVKYINQFESQRANVLTNFHNIILRDTEVVAFPLLSGNIATHQELHDGIVTLASLFDRPFLWTDKRGEKTKKKTT